ncbi:hypothetical protein SCOR_09490 [Sulfidibacter corallicola]|uniref:Uncharacterized protein n=1 Tax=Sulfidibacter corallicola TaxID=2818388 RepID=A0A8A4TPK9_SULCO|nr:hypothetical protein [Sulfidibacter corallicola]QTD51012.1 hypothetical protein J3U87_00955 [Sulfidibacter corallicola]
MSKKKGRDTQSFEGRFTLEDQEFLKKLGISAMPSGVETMLRESRAAKQRDAAIRERADGYLPLEPDEKTLAEMSREQGRPVEEIRKEMRMFRDIKRAPKTLD